MRNETKTLAFVLRRTNYGEADRILNLITPEGKRSAIAKGVRKARSKLAGGVEMFCLSELVIQHGRGELGTVTSAKMLRYYGGLVKDFLRMELAAMILKKVSMVAESSDSPDYFKLVEQSFGGLDEGMDVRLVEGWFLLNLARVVGDEINVYRDASGEKLKAEEKYVWDYLEKAFLKKDGGEFGADEIKMLRLMLTTDLTLVARVKGFETIIPQILTLTRTLYI